MESVKSKEGSVSPLNYPMLGRNNYHAWAIKMKVLMQAQDLWDAVEPKDPNVPVELRKDKMAMAAIYQAIPEELLLSLGEKQSAKEVWDALKTMCTGTDGVKALNLPSLKSENEALNLKEPAGHTDHFSAKLNTNVSNIRLLGYKIILQMNLQMQMLCG